MGLHLSTSLCEPHQCPCGKQVDARGTHGLSCKRGASCSIQHHQLNDIIYRALTRASTPSILEPPGLSLTDGKRPDGLTLIPWQRGKSLTWDVTDTVDDSYLHLTSAKTGGAAENVAFKRRTSTLIFNKRTRSSHWRSKRLDPLTSKARGISSRAGPPPRSHQRRQPSDFIVPANLHPAAAVQHYHVR